MRTRSSEVIHVVNQMRPGGIETMVYDLARLSRIKSRVFSLESATGDLVAGWQKLSTLGTLLEGFEKPPGLAPALVLRLAKRFRALKPSAVFLHRTSPLLYGGLAARIAGVPNIVHVEHDVWQYADPRRLKLLKWSTRMVQPRHFAVSAEIANALERMLPSRRASVVPGGVDLERFCQRPREASRAALGLPLDKSVIGSVGRLEKVKGHRVLVSAMPHLAAEVHVAIVGDGSQRESLLQLAQELGVQERLHLLGHRDDVEHFVSALDVFCLPSLGEGLPRVVMEAQGADVPVVASDVGSVRQVVDEETGHLVPADDPVALANAITARLASPPAPGACRAYAEAHFSIERMVAMYDRVADNIVDAVETRHPSGCAT